jgi:gamma-glutamyltranspeptidase/glutathione hydrolase
VFAARTAGSVLPEMQAGVAAGHPATAQAGMEILTDGGSAADAAVAMCLASCVAETVMTGLLGGGHGIWWDGRRGALVDCFVSAPRVIGEMTHLPIRFGEEVVDYSIGPASCGVPGVPAGLTLLHEAGGRLPWRRLVEPALRLAREGTDLPPRHAACLTMLADLMMLERGAGLYAPEGRLLDAGGVVRQPGLVEAMECLADEGPASAYRGSLAEAVLAVDGVTLTWDDLAAYRAVWREPSRVRRHRVDVLTRGGLSGVPETIARLPRLAGRSATERVLTLVTAFGEAQGTESHTTNLVAVDAAGQACVLTTSLGVGAGAWTPGFDLHLNSMLGETDLALGGLQPGERMESMMAPTLGFEGEGLVLAIGSAGGTRLRTALVSVLAGIVDEELEPQAAVDRPRVHPAGTTVHAEPGIDERALDQLEEQGRTVVRWDDLHHYFGGVSCVARGGAAGDPRRDGVGAVIG